MSKEFVPIPSVPEAVKEAVNEDSLAVFIGAGVSRLVGCDGWADLAIRLLEKCYEENIIDYKEKETLIKFTDHKKTITICYHLFKKNLLENMFFNEMEKSLKLGEEIKCPNIYNEIVKLRGLFITTNADTHFDSHFIPPKVLYDKGAFKADKLDRTNLYHIHGSIMNYSSLIFTVSSYMERYNQPDFIDFLSRIFSEYTVLFLGYGLNEFEILDFILRGKIDSRSTKIHRHFMLNAYYSGEESILEFEQAYYDDLGVKVLGYNIDKKGYMQLEEVLKSWNLEINQVTNYLHDAARFIDEAVKQTMTTDKINSTLQTIKNDKSLEDYFFKKLSVVSNPRQWLIPLKEAGYYDPKNNPQPQPSPTKEGSYKIPHWYALDALVNMAIKNEEDPIGKYSKILLEIINNIAEYIVHKVELPNYRTNWKLFEAISYMPYEYIDKQHIQFIEHSLKTKFGGSLVEAEIGELFLPKLIRGKLKQLIIELLKVILSYQRPDGTHIHEYSSIMDHYFLKKTLSDNKAGIASICAFEAAQVAIGAMRDILNEHKTSFSAIWIPAIEDHEQTEFPDKYECQLVHFARDMLEAADPKEIEPIVIELLNEEHVIFQRVAYHTINHHYASLSKLFWSIDYNPINRDVFHELFVLFKSQSKNFNDKQIYKIIEWIEAHDIKISRAIKGDKEKEAQAKALFKKRWLHALLDTGNARIKQLYEKYHTINNIEVTHPEFYSWHSKGGYIKDVSPIPDDDFKKMTNSEKVDFIISYKPDKSINWDELTEVNLSSSFRRFVSSNPADYTYDIEPFLKLTREYQHELLRGLDEAWKNKKDFDWEALFQFIKQLIGEKAFWEEKANLNYDYNSWILDAVASLIQAGTQDDKHAFPSQLMPAAEEIILMLMDKAKGEMPDLNDIVTSVLNSTKGKVYIAAISFSLRYARLNESDRDSRWKHSIKSEFTKRLDKSLEPGFEFSNILGWHINQLTYLDQQWVKENINTIFDKEHTEHWKSAFIGYLAMTTTLHEGIYKLMRDNNHYEDGLSMSFDEEYVAKKLVQNIILGHIAGWDNLGDSNSLSRKMIDMNNPIYLLETSTFIWGFRNRKEEKYKAKIKSLWGLIIDNIKPNIKEKPYRDIAANLGNWLSLVDEIDDDIFNWLVYTSEAFDEQWEPAFYIEYLLNHATKTPTYVGKLYLVMLNANIYPDYKKENIIGIIQALYNSNEAVIANKICNIYFSNGYEFLRETFISNNKTEL